MLGTSVGHNLSPILQNTLAELTGVNMVYTAFTADREKLKEALEGAAAMGFAGLNLSYPFKREAIPFLKDMDPLCASLGVVTTLIPYEGGFKGFNTDLTGLYRALQEDGIKLEGRHVVILGAGDTARAVATLCIMKDAAGIYVAARKVEQAKELVKALETLPGDTVRKGIALENCVPELKEVCDRAGKLLCFQCTPVGMYPKVKESVVTDAAFFKLLDTAVDLIYRPRETRFLHLAAKAGVDVCENGMKMLVYQGVEAFEKWFGSTISSSEAMQVHDELLKHLDTAQPMVLIGFMGSGKTTVARILSDRLSVRMIDTDEILEQQMNCDIRAMFEDAGDDSFRKKETACLKKLAADNVETTIYSVGGSAPLTVENRMILRGLGRVIYLKTSPEMVYDRLKDDQVRPFLQTEDPLMTVAELLNSREQYYHMAADTIVETDGKTPDQIADEIIKKAG